MNHVWTNAGQYSALQCSVIQCTLLLLSRSTVYILIVKTKFNQLISVQYITKVDFFLRHYNFSFENFGQKNGQKSLNMLIKCVKNGFKKI